MKALSTSSAGPYASAKAMKAFMSGPPDTLILEFERFMNS
jgi:hypothetical protein